MDIDLLSDIISELIVENNSVNLPGVGTFIKEEAPAVISDRGYTINPPYYRLAFISRGGQDGLIASRYSGKEGISLKDAEKTLSDFMEGLKDVLFRERSVLFPGLGKLRVTLENEFFFVSDDNPDLFPELFALEPVSIGVRNASAESSTSIKPIPVNAPSSSDEPGRDTIEPPKEKPRKKKHRFLRFCIIVLVLAILAAGAFVFLMYYYPEILDRILYPDPADLEIVRLML